MYKGKVVPAHWRNNNFIIIKSVIRQKCHFEGLFSIIWLSFCSLYQNWHIIMCTCRFFLLTHIKCVFLKVMESLSELNRSTLSPVVDSNITALVQHSMGVAHLAAGSYRDLVVACCHRVSLIISVSLTLTDTNIH